AIRLEALPPLPQRLGVVEAKNLDVREPEAEPFDDRQYLGKGGGIAAGENVLADPGIGLARPVHAADRMDHRDAAAGEKLLHLGEILAVTVDADMLAHADRDDAVVAAVLGAVLAQPEGAPCR